MKRSELMIANLVYIIDRTQNIHIPIEIPMEIIEIGQFESIVLRCDTIPLESQYLKIPNIDLYPIPLSHTWVLKMGFTIDNDSWFYSYDFDKIKETFKIFELTAGGKRSGMWGIVGCPQLLKKISSVHELQNVFKILSGQHLKITLNYGTN